MSLKGVFVMKKILCLLVLLLSLTATCAAFNPPQPPRWYWIGSDAHYGAWIDTATARFYIGSKEYGHSNHQCALVWVEWYDADKDDDGHTEWYFENFEDLCEQVVNGALDNLIEEEHLDISDETYNRAIEYGRDWLADTLADFESECIQDYVSDQKYILDEVWERNGRC